MGFARRNLAVLAARLSSAAHGPTVSRFSEWLTDERMNRYGCLVAILLVFAAWFGAAWIIGGQLL